MESDSENFYDSLESLVDYRMKPEKYEKLSKELQLEIIRNDELVSVEEYRSRILPLIDEYIKREL